MLSILFIALVGGIIGWITNIFAIKMLFRPINPVIIPFLKLNVQGLIPKRRMEISKSIGEAVENDLINIEDILDKVVTAEGKKQALEGIKSKINDVIIDKIPSLVPSSIKSRIVGYINEQIDKDGNKILDKTINEITDKAMDKIKIGKMVEEKINEFELEEIEKIVLKLSSKELKHIELLGGVLGVTIGLVQGVIIKFIL